MKPLSGLKIGRCLAVGDDAFLLTAEVDHTIHSEFRWKSTSVRLINGSVPVIECSQERITKTSHGRGVLRHAMHVADATLPHSTDETDLDWFRFVDAR